MRPLLVGAAQVPLAHRHRLDPVPGEELLKPPLHVRVGDGVRAHPPSEDRLSALVANDRSGDLGGGRPIVGAE
jgi:hypothetical protein